MATAGRATPAARRFSAHLHGQILAARDINNVLREAGSPLRVLMRCPSGVLTIRDITSRRRGRLVG